MIAASDAGERRMPLLIRADADTAIGAGHVMRNLAIAQAWRRRFASPSTAPIVFVCAAIREALAARLASSASIDVRRIDAVRGSAADLQATIDVARDLGRAIASPAVVVDGYVFDGPYEAAIAREASTVLAWDDDGHTTHAAPIVLNQNLDAVAPPYAPDAANAPRAMLVGARYACLRREFVAAVPRTDRGMAIARAVRRPRVLVTFGGADFVGVTLRAARAVAALDVDVRVIVVGAEAARAATQAAAALAPQQHVDVRVDVADMVEHMQWCDVAVGGAGSTAWELCRLGVPFVSIALADNQRAIAAALARHGVARVVGSDVAAVNATGAPIGDAVAALLADAVAALLADAGARGEMSARAVAVVDGAGADRVVDVIVDAVVDAASARVVGDRAEASR